MTDVNIEYNPEQTQRFLNRAEVRLPQLPLQRWTVLIEKSTSLDSWVDHENSECSPFLLVMISSKKIYAELMYRGC